MQDISKFSKKTDSERNPTEILEVKSSVNQIKNCNQSFNNKVDQVEEYLNLKMGF